MDTTDTLRRGLLAADPRLSRFTPLERILHFDDFNTGQHGWQGYFPDYDGWDDYEGRYEPVDAVTQALEKSRVDSLRIDRKLPFGPRGVPMLSSLTSWDVGSAGALTGTYALKIPTLARRRLELEAMRDTLLVAAGQLDLRGGGLPDDLVAPPFSKRRTVYGFIDRQNLPGMFRAFDFASPDASAAGRFMTTVPQQALFLMNNPFVIEQARQVVRRPELRSAFANDEKLAILYGVIFQRAPDEEELRMALGFIETPWTPPAASEGEQNEPLTPWEALVHVLLLSNELVFID